MHASHAQPKLSEAPSGDPTVRQRMEALGWQLAICEDSCESSWIKVEAGRIVAYQEVGGRFAADLEACQRAYGFLSGRSHYA